MELKPVVDVNSPLDPDDDDGDGTSDGNDNCPLDANPVRTIRTAMASVTSVTSALTRHPIQLWLQTLTHPFTGVLITTAMAS